MSEASEASEASEILRSLRYFLQEEEAELHLAVEHSDITNTRHMRGVVDGIKSAIQIVESFL